MRRRTMRVDLLLGAVLLASCAGTAPAREASPSLLNPTRLGNAQVVTSAQLHNRGGNLLDALIGRISTMRVERPAGRCPVITMRGLKTIEGNLDPRVYVDGTPMVDTCVLSQLRAMDVERVEVYPGGFTNRPGYRAHPNGLILVFLTGASAAR